VRREHEYYGSNIEIDAYGLTSALEEMYGNTSVTHDRYRSLFSSTDGRYKRFLKKQWEYRQTLPSLDDINRLYRKG
jgi:hypothetical protein